MKKRVIALGMLALAGCAQLASLTGFSISQSELQSRLNQQLDGWSQDLGKELGVETHIDQLDIKLADQKARIDVGGEAALSRLFKAVPLAIHLSVEGTPSLEGKAVYLRNVRLLAAKADLLGYSGSLGPDTSAMGKWLTQYLDNHPVYRIPDSSPFAHIPLNMTVGDGKLQFKAAN